MPTVLVISRDADFSGAVAEAVERELASQAVVAESAEKGQKLARAVQAIVSSEALEGKWPAPVIPVAAGKDTPVKLTALLAQVRDAMASGRAPEIKLGKEHHFSLQAKTIVHLSSGKTVQLTGKEAELLLALAGAKNKNVGREALLKNVWGGTGLESHALETHIYRLRAKLLDAGFRGSIVVSGGGYALKVK